MAGAAATGITVTIGGANYNYPVDYGKDRCRRYDDPLAPMCSSGTSGASLGADYLPFAVRDPECS